MGANAYELLALAMRYVFAGLMVLVVIRAWRITMVDNRRAARLRRLSPDTGIIGEMLVVNGSERAKPGMRYSVTLEGSIGSGRRSDIRIRHSSVRGRHAIYQMTDDGLFVRGHASARIRDGHGRLAKQLVLHDGEILRIGEVALMLVLTGADSAPEEMNRSIRRRHSQERASTEEFDDFGGEFDNSLFETAPDPDDLFMTNPAGGLDGGFGEDFDDPFDDDFDKTDDREFASHEYEWSRRRHPR